MNTFFLPGESFKHVDTEWQPPDEPIAGRIQ
jgi:hypothetical protein